MIGGPELRLNAPLIPPVTIFAANVRNNLRRAEIHVAKLPHQLSRTNHWFGQHTKDRR